MTATHVGEAWSCTVRLVVGDDRVLRRAAADLDGLLDRVDRAASRFRADSELSRANDRFGRPVPVSPLLLELIDAALDAQRRSDGAVDPLLGRTMEGLGYDRDLGELDLNSVGDSAATTRSVHPPRERRSLRVDRRLGLVTVPPGFAVDLGATAKAWTADRAASTLATRYATSVLVELGGDLAVAGPARPWRIDVAERAGGPGQRITLPRGGIATSTTVVRTWQQDGARRHHLIDPATGQPTDGPWRTVSVAARSAFEANVAAAAAIVKGDGAREWLAGQDVDARLIARDGAVTTTGSWPADAAAVA